MCFQIIQNLLHSLLCPLKLFGHVVKFFFKSVEAICACSDRVRTSPLYPSQPTPYVLAANLQIHVVMGSSLWWR